MLLAVFNQQLHISYCTVGAFRTEIGTIMIKASLFSFVLMTP